MNRTLIKDACEGKGAGEEILVQGWVRTRRDSRTFSFLEINDGTCLRNIQAIVDRPRHAEVSPATTGSSVSVTGKLVPSRGRGQAFEIVVDTLEIVGGADATYPLQKKGHSPEYLREIAHLRPRSNLFGSVFRVRSRLALAIHRFFEERGFHHIHTPIITSSDCEGAGELFRVTAGGSRETNGREFFGQPAYLTVSGQLAAEAFACALSKVYTFGPTFRAENSNTSRHASEFWMLEPEMAFCDLQGNMTMAEDCIKYLLGDLMDRCPDELDLFNRFVDKKLVERIRFVIERSFRHISHGEAVRLQVIVAGKLQVVVEGLAIDGQLGCAGLSDGVYAFLCSGVYEVDPRLGALGQPGHLAEGNVFGNVVVGQVQVGAVVAALPFQLVLHVGDDVVLFGVHRHYAAVLPHLLEYLPKVAHGHTGVEGGEYLEAGDARLDCLTNLPQSNRRNGPGEDVVEGVISIGVTPKHIPPDFNLTHDGIGWRYGPWRQRQRSGEVHVGSNPPERGSPTGCLGRLSEDAGVAASPVVRHRHVDVGVRFDTAGQHDHPGGVYRLTRSDIIQCAGRGHRCNLLALDAHIHEAGASGRNHCSALDNQVQHDCLPKSTL